MVKKTTVQEDKEWIIDCKNLEMYNVTLLSTTGKSPFPQEHPAYLHKSSYYQNIHTCTYTHKHIERYTVQGRIQGGWRCQSTPLSFQNLIICQLTCISTLNSHIWRNLGNISSLQNCTLKTNCDVPCNLWPTVTMASTSSLSDSSKISTDPEKTV